MNNILKKNNRIYIIITTLVIISEIVLSILLSKVEAKLTMLSVMVAIPFIIICFFQLIKSLENSILISLALIPLLPISGYVLLRCNMLDWQWLIYVIFYLISAGSMIKNGIIDRIKSTNVKKSKFNIFKIILFILLIINVVFAYNKQLSCMIISLSFVPFVIYMYLIDVIAGGNKKEFYEKVIVYISIGSILSSTFDIIYFVMLWINGEKDDRIFGPLGSNFILMYDLIIFVILLNKWVKQKGFKNIWSILTLLMAFIISMQLSRGALLSFICIMIAYITFNIKNWKKYLLIIIVFGPLLTYNVMGRADVKADTSIQELEITIVDKPQEELSGENKISYILMKIVESQSRNRQILWKAGIAITSEYPITGVGLGNFKYFFQEYSGSDRPYLDSHNIILNMSSEIGLPFTLMVVVFMLYVIVYGLWRYFNKKYENIKLNYLSIVICCGVIFLYGNLTGMSLQVTNEVYSFTPTFILIFLMFYYENISDM